MTWISSFVNGGPCWMPPNQANWKLASGDMTESTVGSSSVLFHSSTLKATSSGGLEAIPTSKIEKQRRKNSLRRSVSFAGLPMLYRKPLSSWTRRATRSMRTRQCSTIPDTAVSCGLCLSLPCESTRGGTRGGEGGGGKRTKTHIRSRTPRHEN